MEERGVRADSGETVVEVDPRYFRPTEVDLLLGDPSKARRKLGWERRITFSELVTEMVRADLDLFKRDLLCREAGYSVCPAVEEQC